MRMELGDGNNYFHDFFVDFWKDKTIIRKQEYPVGQIAADMLNVSDEEIGALVTDSDALSKHFNRIMAGRERITPAFMRGVTDILSRMNIKFLKLPMYQRLEVDLANHNLMPEYFSHQRNCTPLGNTGSMEFLALRAHISYYAQAPAGLKQFKETITRLEREKFSSLERRDADSYVKAARQFFGSNPYTFNQKPYPLDKVNGEFVPFVPLMMAYIYCDDPKDKSKTIIAERTFFDDMFSFLSSDFYRGLQYGHAPMRCANCGRYFLNEKGYANRRYCDGRDPSQPEYTCRQIGTENKNRDINMGKEPASGSLPKKLCRNAKNRFRGACRYGTISEADRDRLLDEVDRLRTKALRGKLTDKELEEALSSEALYRKLKIKKLK